LPPKRTRIPPCFRGVGSETWRRTRRKKRTEEERRLTQRKTRWEPKRDLGKRRRKNFQGFNVIKRNEKGRKKNSYTESVCPPGSTEPGKGTLTSNKICSKRKTHAQEKTRTRKKTSDRKERLPSGQTSERRYKGKIGYLGGPKNENQKKTKWGGGSIEGLSDA